MKKHYNARKNFTLKGITEFVVIVGIVIFGIIQMYDVVTHIERYSTTELNALKQAVNAGDPVAIQYYEETYLVNGEVLF